MTLFDMHVLIPSPEDREMARLTGQTLADAGGHALRFRLGDKETTCEFPASVVKVLSEMMLAMGEGQSFAVLPMQSELTVQRMFRNNLQRASAASRVIFMICVVP